ncbi:hypothetical protein N9H93_02850 [Rhizobiaceae bacterium]|nr:hypothetical protein [Rhizobiaceae bacterium]
MRKRHLNLDIVKREPLSTCLGRQSVDANLMARLVKGCGLLYYPGVTSHIIVHNYCNFQFRDLSSDERTKGAYKTRNLSPRQQLQDTIMARSASAILAALLTRARRYLQVMYLLFRKAYSFAPGRIIRAQVMMILGFSIEIGSVLLIIRLLVAEFISVPAIAGYALLGCTGYFLSCFGRNAVLRIAMDYERFEWQREFHERAEQTTQGVVPPPMNNDQRYITVVMRQLLQLPANVLVAIPTVLILIYMSPEAVLGVGALVLVSLVPLALESRYSALVFDRYLSSGSKVSANKRFLATNPTRYDGSLFFKNQTDWEAFQRSKERSSLYLGVLTPLAVSFLVLLYLAGKIDAANAVTFLIVLRFVLGQVVAILGTITNVNRHYGVLAKT